MATQNAAEQDIDIRTMFDSNYIGAWDLQGRAVTVTISKVSPGELSKAGTSKKDRAPIIHFEGREKGMVVNKTNLHTIASIAGSYKRKAWIGVRITLFATTCSFGRNIVDCIRVKAQAPSAKTPDAPPEEPAAREAGMEG